MKNILRGLLLITLIIGLSACSSTLAKTKGETNNEVNLKEKNIENKLLSKEVENLKVEAGIESAKISWNISDISDVEKIEILTRQSNGNIFKSIKKIAATEKETELPLPSFVKFDIKVRLIGKNGSISNGVTIQTVSQMKNVVLDNCEGREMQIYLPPGYETSNERYPVVYMHDGQNLFNKRTAPNGEWMIDETMDRLIAENKIEKMIVVGIYNTSGRWDDYCPYVVRPDKNISDRGGKADVFAEFIVKKLIQYVDGKYRTIPNRENRATMGSSLGGLLSFWLGLHYSDVFSMAGAFSPSLGVMNNKFLDELKEIPKKNVKFWIDCGSKEFWDGHRKAVDILMSEGYIYGKDVVYCEGNGEDHHETAWTNRAPSALTFFKGKNQEPKLIDFTTQVEIINNPYIRGDIDFIIINPFAEFENGMKYTLYAGVTFSATGNAKFNDCPHYVFEKDNDFFTEDTPVDAHITGNLILNGDKETEVTVKYNGIERNILVKEADCNK